MFSDKEQILQSSRCILWSIPAADVQLPSIIVFVCEYFFLSRHSRIKGARAWLGGKRIICWGRKTVFRPPGLHKTSLTEQPKTVICHEWELKVKWEKWKWRKGRKVKVKWEKTVFCPPGFHSSHMTEGPKAVISHEYQWELKMAVKITDLATSKLLIITPALSTLKIKISDKFRWFVSLRQATQGQGWSFGFKIQKILRRI